MRHNNLAVSALLSLVSVVNGECAADNCLRALTATQTPGRLEAAQSFCATYTAAPASATAIPSWASGGCKADENGDESYRLSSACSCIAPATTATSLATQTASPTEPCAIVSSSWSAQVNFATPTPTVSAELAHACLNSIPLGKEEAIEFVDSIVPYLEWQSDAAYKANPPADYPYPAYDMFANLAKIKENLVADVYANEYEFQTDLYVSVFGPGHDGHFVLYPDALTKVFDFRRQVALVSIAEEGGSLPVIKVYEDMLASPDTASVVTLINGIDAATYLQDTVDKANWNQDKDAAYNSMFHTLLNPTGYFKQGGRIRFLYQGPTTTLTFENGTVATLVNTAGVGGNMAGVFDGPSFYTKFCAVANSSVEVSSQGLTGSDASVTPGYPEPVGGTTDGVVTGYFLEGEGFEDVAVLALTAFESESVAEFQAVTQDFLANATAAGKTKLVVDFQNNGGGYILLGYDFFRQLFPSIDQGGNSRWKENNGSYAMAEVASDAVDGLNILTSDDGELIYYYETWLNWRYDLNDTNGPFTSFDDKFAPHVYQDTNYTNLMRWNLNDPLMKNISFGMGIDISGYGSRTNLTQPFAPEDIIIIYDGVCASTCTLAAEFLRVSAGVKSIAFGGRPIEGPIQGLGGIKGAQVLQFGSIWSMAEDLKQYATTDEQKAEFARYSTLPLQRATSASVNTRDQILPDNINDGLPAQYVREPSDCRLYWTWPMMTNATATWKAAAAAAFNGGACAAGGIEKPAKREAKPKLSAADKFRNPPMTAEKRAELLSKRVPTTPLWEAIYRQVAVY